MTPTSGTGRCAWPGQTSASPGPTSARSPASWTRTSSRRRSWSTVSVSCMMTCYMLIHDVTAPPHSVQIHPAVTGDGDKYLNVSCEVAGVYPLPVIDLSWSNKWDNISKYQYLNISTPISSAPPPSTWRWWTGWWGPRTRGCWRWRWPRCCPGTPSLPRWSSPATSPSPTPGTPHTLSGRSSPPSNTPVSTEITSIVTLYL